MKRENQVFKGKLKDKELYLIEDALVCLKEKYEDITANNKKIKNIERLILKLYENFSEVYAKKLK